jgi:hypothetical protein
MNKKLFLVPAFVLIATFAYSGTALADEAEQPWHERIVNQIAAKFGLGEDEVDSAMTEVQAQFRAERQLAMQNRFEERLQSLVDAGTLTTGQAEAWTAKHEEWQAEREAQMTAHREEMQAWFDEQGIDPTVLGPMGMGKDGGMGMGGGRGMHAGW